MTAKWKSMPRLGWREWVALPDLGIPLVKVKVDTGARTSALHAFDAEPFRRRGKDWIRFGIHPIQRDDRTEIVAEAEVLDRRRVKSSNGQVQNRWIIQTELGLGEDSWPIELTLTSRDEMGFRMLLGREAIRNRFLVDPGSSYCAGRHTARDVLRSYRRKKSQ